MIQKDIDRPKPRKLFLKLALFQLPIYVVLVGLGIFSLTFEQERQARETYAASIGNSAARAASALQKAEGLQIADPALTEQIEVQILTMLGGNIAIRCAELVAQGKVQVSYPNPVGCKVQSASTFYEFEVGGNPGKRHTTDPARGFYHFPHWLFSGYSEQLGFIPTHRRSST